LPTSIKSSSNFLSILFKEIIRTLVHRSQVTRNKSVRNEGKMRSFPSYQLLKYFYSMWLRIYSHRFVRPHTFGHKWDWNSVCVCGWKTNTLWPFLLMEIQTCVNEWLNVIWVCNVNKICFDYCADCWPQCEEWLHKYLLICILLRAHTFDELFLSVCVRCMTNLWKDNIWVKRSSVTAANIHRINQLCNIYGMMWYNTYSYDSNRRTNENKRFWDGLENCELEIGNDSDSYRKLNLNSHEEGEREWHVKWHS